jgi:hypothetical protein
MAIADVKAALSAMTVKTDRKDLRGDCAAAAHGMVSPGPREVAPCKDTRALLVERKLLQGKLLDVESSVHHFGIDNLIDLTKMHKADPTLLKR